MGKKRESWEWEWRFQGVSPGQGSQLSVDSYSQRPRTTAKLMVWVKWSYKFRLETEIGIQMMPEVQDIQYVKFKADEELKR